MIKLESIRFLLQNPIRLLAVFVIRLPFFSFIRKTGHYQNKITLLFWFNQKVLGVGGNKEVYWPVHRTSQVYDWHNIYAGVDTCPGLMKGCYIQGKGGIHIGDYTQIAPNVIIVSANHDLYDSRNFISNKVTIGKYCWIGAGAKIMPGVTLGDFTIVGAGSVVTKSFPSGHCIIGGVPAKCIKDLDKEKCLRYELEPKFYGYLNEEKFKKLREKYPSIT